MKNIYRKFLILFTLSLLAIGLIVWIVNRYNRHQEDTWYCYNTQGQPAEGVMIVCRYGLANYPKVALTHRFSDAKGKIVLDLDWDTPSGLIRGITCIYSSKLRSGCPGEGERWHKGRPAPDTAVYFDEWNNKLFIKSGDDDPTIWHPALNAIIETYQNMIMHKSSKGIPGKIKLEKALSALVPNERKSFLEKYGDEKSPMDYVNTGNVLHYFPRAAKNPNSNLLFKDITLEIP